jgi:hypothetical protein
LPVIKIKTIKRDNKKTMPQAQNVMNFIVKVACDAIQGNISSTITASKGSSITNKSLTNLNKAWTTCTESNPHDPGYSIYEQLEIAAAGGTTGMDNFIQQFIEHSSVTTANQLSSAFITSVIIDLQAAYKSFSPSQSSPGNLSIDLAACNAMNTLISSASANETQPLQTTAKTFGSLLQQCQSAIQSLAGIGDLANDLSSSLIALVSQQY